MAETKTGPVTAEKSSDTRDASRDAGVANPGASALTLSKSTDDVRRENSQPQGLEPEGDVVAMVSRDVNGDPKQSKNFTVLVPEGVSDAERDAHWNKSGEDQGAKHLSGGGREEVPMLGIGDGFTEEERGKRADTERRELHRHNFREDAP